MGWPPPLHHYISYNMSFSLSLLWSRVFFSFHGFLLKRGGRGLSDRYLELSSRDYGCQVRWVSNPYTQCLEKNPHIYNKFEDKVFTSDTCIREFWHPEDVTIGFGWVWLTTVEVGLNDYNIRCLLKFSNRNTCLKDWSCWITIDPLLL